MSDFKPKSPLFEAVNEKAQEYLAETGPNRQQILEELMELTRQLAALLVQPDLFTEREEIAQETAIAAWRALKRDGWDGKNPFSAYVNGIVKRLSIGYYRQKRERMLNTVSIPIGDGEDGFAEEHKLAVQPVEYFDRDAYLRAAELTSKQKEVVELWCKDYTSEEIATKTGLAEGTVSTHLHRARQKIRGKWLSKNRRRTQSGRRRQSHSPRRRFLGIKVNWKYFVVVGHEIIECRGVGRGGRCSTRFKSLSG